MTLATPLYPDAAAEAKLMDSCRIADEIRDAVTRFLVQSAGQNHLRLLDIASYRTGNHSGSTSSKLRVTRQQLLTELRDARDALGWGRVLPTASISRIGLNVLDKLSHGHRDLHLAKPWLELDGGVWPIDPFRVALHLLGTDAVQWADVFALPLQYSAALTELQDRHLQGEQRRFLQARTSFLAGDQTALGECMRIGGRVQPGDLTPNAAARHADTGQAIPEATERAIIRQVQRPGGALGWDICWQFTVPGPFPTASLADVVGVDVGATPLLTWASGLEVGSLPQQLVWLPMPIAPAHGFGQAPTPYNAQLGRAWGRRLIFEALRPGYETAIRQLLRYERIALEDIDWQGFQTGFRFGEFADLAHLHTALSWLESLAPLHGSQVIWVDPRYSSRTCSCCGWVNRKRPRKGELFRCERPGCRHLQDPHINAGLVHRSRVMAGSTG